MDSRTSEDGTSIRRRRECPKCGRPFGKTVNPVVEQQYIDVDITSDTVYKVVATDSEAVAGYPMVRLVALIATGTHTVGELNSGVFNFHAV